MIEPSVYKPISNSPHRQFVSSAFAVVKRSAGDATAMRSGLGRTAILVTLLAALATSACVSATIVDSSPRGNHVGDRCLDSGDVFGPTIHCVDGLVCCVDGLACDSTTMLCEEAHTGPLRKGCVSDDECASGHCAGTCCQVACKAEYGCGSIGVCADDGLRCAVAASGTYCPVDLGPFGSVCLDARTSLNISAAKCDGLGACKPFGDTSVCATTETCDPSMGLCVTVPSDGGAEAGDDAGGKEAPEMPSDATTNAGG
jgi:hypothetical protein